MADFSYLKPHILDILRAPGVDLSHVSAKKVRKELEARIAGLDVKVYKAEIDAVIVEAFNEVMPASEAEDEPEPTPAPPPAPVAVAAAPAPPVASTSNGNTPTAPKRKRAPSYDEDDEDDLSEPEEDDDDDDGVPASSPAFALAAKPKSKPKAKAEMTDEELARQLHMEMNSRTSRSGRSRAMPSKSSGSRAKKSSQYVDDSDDDDDGIIDRDSTSKPKKRVKKERDPDAPKSQTGFNKPWALSAELAAIVGADTMSRGQVTKQLWVYIKENNLQDPRDRRNINCDDKLQAVLGTTTTNAFKMNKPLQKHFWPIDA